MTKGSRTGGKAVKRAIYQKDQTCFRCGLRFALEQLQLHHLKPIRHGGNTSESNTCLLCPNCHCYYHKMFDEFLNKVKNQYTEEQYRKHLKTH